MTEALEQACRRRTITEKRPPVSLSTSRLALPASSSETATAIRRLRRRGAVVAVSGGVDSGVVAGICVRAVGPEHVLCLRLPGARHRRLVLAISASSWPTRLARGRKRSRSPRRSRAWAATGAATRRSGAFSPTTSRTGGTSWFAPRRPAGSIVFSLVVERPDGSEEQRRMPSGRVPRAALGHEHEAARAQAPRVHLGRPARLRRGRDPEPARVRPGVLRQGRRRARGREADRAPLQDPGLRRWPASSACRRRSPRAHPTTETFSLPQTQEEFYFGHPYERMDLLMWGHASGVAPAELAARVDLRADEVEAAYREIERRRVATEYLHAPPILVDPDRLTCAASQASCRPHARRPVDEQALLRMAAAIRHRGPDGFGLALDAGAGLVSTRLAIFDLPRRLAAV